MKTQEQAQVIADLGVTFRDGDYFERTILVKYRVSRDDVPKYARSEYDALSEPDKLIRAAVLVDKRGRPVEEIESFAVMHDGFEYDNTGMAVSEWFLNRLSDRDPLSAAALIEWNVHDAVEAFCKR